METSPARPNANRPLAVQSSSSIESRNNPVSELQSSNGSHPAYSLHHHHHGKDPSNAQQQQAPFFERVGVRGDVKVVQNYSRIVKQQNARLRELEKIHRDLEARLELETKQKELFETTLEEKEREWERRLECAVAEREKAEKELAVERKKNEQFSLQLSRKDQDIHRMMQRKYDPDMKRSVRHVPIERERATPLSASSSPADPRRSEGIGQRGPHDFLFMKDPPDATREKNVVSLLGDLFGMNN